MKKKVNNESLVGLQIYSQLNQILKYCTEFSILIKEVFLMFYFAISNVINELFFLIQLGGKIIEKNCASAHILGHYFFQLVGHFNN